MQATVCLLQIEKQFIKTYQWTCSFELTQIYMLTPNLAPLLRD